MSEWLERFREPRAEDLLDFGIIAWIMIGLMVITITLIVAMKFRGAVLAGIIWIVFWLIMIFLALLVLGEGFSESIVVIGFPGV